MTRRTGNLRLMSSDWLEVHPDDATALGLRDGETVTVRSRRGQIELPVQVTPRIEPGHVFTAFHFPEVRTNLLIGQSADVNTSCPEYKVVAVAIEPVGDGRRSRGRRREPRCRRLGAMARSPLEGSAAGMLRRSSATAASTRSPSSCRSRSA